MQAFFILFSYDTQSTEQAFLMESVSVYCEVVTLFFNNCYITFLLRKAKTIALT
jgi:hypothetical protein